MKLEVIFLKEKFRIESIIFVRRYDMLFLFCLYIIGFIFRADTKDSIRKRKKYDAGCVIFLCRTLI